MVALAPDATAYELVSVPRAAVRFPVELPAPRGFSPSERDTWPKVDGRFEYVEGRLLYMPPCGELQQLVATGVTGVLARWGESRSEFRIGSNEAGMLLGGESRGAEAAVWRVPPGAPPPGTGFARHAPILAVEVEGEDEDEAELRAKAGWYLDHGVETVWLVLHGPRRVLVLIRGGERRFAAGATIAEHGSLPGLAPDVDDLFRFVR